MFDVIYLCFSITEKIINSKNTCKKIIWVAQFYKPKKKKKGSNNFNKSKYQSCVKVFFSSQEKWNITLALQLYRPCIKNGMHKTGFHFYIELNAMSHAQDCKPFIAKSNTFCTLTYVNTRNID